MTRSSSTSWGVEGHETAWGPGTGIGEWAEICDWAEIFDWEKGI